MIAITILLSIMSPYNSRRAFFHPLYYTCCIFVGAFALFISLPSPFVDELSLAVQKYWQYKRCEWDFEVWRNIEGKIRERKCEANYIIFRARSRSVNMCISFWAATLSISFEVFLGERGTAWKLCSVSW